MKIVIKAKSDDHGFSRLHVAGLRVEKTREDEDGNTVHVRREDQIERCLTPSLVCTDGDVVFAVEIRPEFVDKIPTHSTPNFKVEWREDELIDSGEVDGEGNAIMVQAPWPEYEVNTYDEDGVVNGTTMQGAGRIV